MKKKDDIAIVISGEAGQGLQTLEKLLSRIAKLSGFHVFTASEFMSRIRGGNNSSLIRISSNRINAAVSRIDIFIPLSPDGIARFTGRITDETIIYADIANIEPQYRSSGFRIRGMPYAEISRECGGGKCLNIVITGFLCGLLGISEEILLDEARKRLGKLDEESVLKNIAAAKKGYAAGRKETIEGDLQVSLKSSEDVRNELLMEGTSAIGIGALAGGCNFMASYPMSPSSNLLAFMAEKAPDFELAVEQAEDEISAVNMACGSWYAGGRAMVTTSGGGFSLMTEGLSLAGCTETPLVIHLAQRPGPATGLPTRTEQGDLNLALYAGHGDFPRILYAPGDFAQGIDLARRAFNMADKYQVPVFILTDQYFLDSSYNVENIDPAPLKAERHIIKTAADYKRYRITDNGISPRGIPGWGDGTVRLDSDEHTEEGFITEDFSVRKSMVDKRLRKLNGMGDDGVPPRLIGGRDYRVLLVGWGSTYHIVREALRVSGTTGVSFLHFSQVYPLPPQSADYLSKAEKLIMIENNATGQFGRLIEAATGFRFGKWIFKYDGRQFTVEEIVNALSEAERS
jgi:2-oxoglutarate ferredoxin oxidoreductase subunit alpha